MIDANKRLEALRSEVEAAIEPTEAALRGLERCLRQPLKPETLQEVSALLGQFKRRISILKTLARALSDTASYVDTLLLDGFPELPASDDAAAAEDLDEAFAQLSRFRDWIASLGGRAGVEAR